LNAVLQPMPMPFEDAPLEEMLRAAAAVRDAGHEMCVTWSPKVFIPLTHLCRDVCHYCTFAKAPRGVSSPYLEPDAVLAIARAGAAAGCHEALFTLGDRPELRYAAARRALESLGFDSTHAYLAHIAERVRMETGLLPHINCGVLDESEFRAFRRVAPSMGLMLESGAARLTAKGLPHHGSPDKQPAVRFASIAAAGRAAVPLTTGLLVGIGETRAERWADLVALHALQGQYGHLQELIIQNFVPKPGTRMAQVPPPPFEELLWTVAAARLLFGPEMSIQVPPNLNGGRLGELLGAGLNDWGGVSPVTPDHVNPESPWPHIEVLRAATEQAGKCLVERLTVYPRFVRERTRWLDGAIATAVLARADAEGLARTDAWEAGVSSAPPRPTALPRVAAPAALTHWPRFSATLARAAAGARLDPAQVTELFAARGSAVDDVCAAADQLRRAVVGDDVTFVANRNINYTNICTYKCGFCAFSKGRSARDLRGPAYLLDLNEIASRTREAWQMGATEVCLQGGIHPSFDGHTYLAIARAVQAAEPAMHIHAFSPLEVTHGAETLGLPLRDYLAQLRDAGLRSLPGTAAEILDDEVRAIICPDKLTTAQWLSVMQTAHAVGLRSTATIMFGHVEAPLAWARHLLAIRDLQADTGGFTEFVPLPFVHREAPMARRGLSRPGPTWREARLMHAVARLVLHPLVPNIQASWVKLSPAGAAACLSAGVNDLGGTLINESISRAAGAQHGQGLTREQMRELIRASGRQPRQRSTLYGTPPVPASAAAAYA
jgi:FO synthase